MAESHLSPIATRWWEQCNPRAIDGISYKTAKVGKEYND